MPLYLNSGPEIYNPRRHGVSRLLAQAVVLEWEPDDKTGLRYWFEGDFGVTFDGSNLISNWTDQALVGDAIQATAAFQPLYVANALNGLAGTRWDATAGMIYGAGTVNFTIGTPTSMFVILQGVAQGGTWYATINTIKGSIASRNFSVILSNDVAYGNLNVAYAGVGGVNTRVGISAASADLLSAPCSLVINYTGGDPELTASYTIYVNGVSQALSLPGGTHSHLGNYNALGSYGSNVDESPSFPFNGDLYEIGGYSSEMSAGEIADFHGYAVAKWGI